MRLGGDYFCIATPGFRGHHEAGPAQLGEPDQGRLRPDRHSQARRLFGYSFDSRLAYCCPGLGPVVLGLSVIMNKHRRIQAWPGLQAPSADNEVAALGMGVNNVQGQGHGRGPGAQPTPGWPVPCYAPLQPAISSLSAFTMMETIIVPVHGRAGRHGLGHRLHPWRGPSSPPCRSCSAWWGVTGDSFRLPPAALRGDSGARPSWCGPQGGHGQGGAEAPLALLRGGRLTREV